MAKQIRRASTQTNKPLTPRTILRVACACHNVLYLFVCYLPMFSIKAVKSSNGEKKILENKNTFNHYLDRSVFTSNITHSLQMPLTLDAIPLQWTNMYVLALQSWICDQPTNKKEKLSLLSSS